jgi:hypothetical protein
MNPQDIKITGKDGSDGIIEMNTAGSKKSVKIEHINFPDEKDEETSWSVIWVTDKESATRISNALSHAIKLCGGKPDPF